MLPAGAVTLETFPDLKLQPNQTVEQHYAILMDLYRQMCRAGYSGGQDSGQSSGAANGDGAATDVGPGDDSDIPNDLQRPLSQHS